MPPPKPRAELPLRVQLLTVRVAFWLLMPPPTLLKGKKPLVIVSPAMVTVLAQMPNTGLAALPLTAK